jgi:hypothetical protein
VQSRTKYTLSRLVVYIGSDDNEVLTAALRRDHNLCVAMLVLCVVGVCYLCRYCLWSGHHVRLDGLCC